MNLAIIAVLSTMMAGGCVSKIASEDSAARDPSEEAGSANIVSVAASGSQENYQFAVGIQSPDIDCTQYASWWEVVDMDGGLVYRRILTHSHPTEQPFIRSGGPVQIDAAREVIIRAYMHPSGYGGTAFQGSVEAGFEAVQLSGDFAAKLSEADPLPTVCTG